MTVNSRITGYDYPDPDVIRVDDVYYMASTTMYYFPGGVILRSRDLINWEIATYIFDSLDDTSAERLEGGENIYGKGMWAPSLRYFEGRFYVAFVSHGQPDTHLFVSENIEGPWEHRRIKGYYHDCSLLFDGQKKYIVHGNTKIRITELNDEMTEPLKGGLDKVIVSDDKDKVALGYEGSHIYKIYGKYVLTLIHWPQNGMRTQAVFVSDSPEGAYFGKDVLSDDAGFYGQGVAQGGFVDTPDKKWFAVLFQDSGAIGRIPRLVPVELENDFPKFGIDMKAPKEIEINTKKHEDTLYSNEYPQLENGTLSKKSVWQWNHVPDYGMVKPESGDILRLRTRNTSFNPMWARNTLTQRLHFDGNEIRVFLDASQINNGDTAGLLILNSFYKMFGIRKKENKFYIVLLEGKKPANPYVIGFDDKEKPAVLCEREISMPEQTLKAVVKFEKMEGKVQFYFGKDERIGEELEFGFELNLFTGARVGLCLYSETNPGGEAVFGKFDIKPLEIN